MHSVLSAKLFSSKCGPKGGASPAPIMSPLKRSEYAGEHRYSARRTCFSEVLRVPASLPRWSVPGTGEANTQESMQKGFPTFCMLSVRCQGTQLSTKVGFIRSRGLTSAGSPRDCPS